MRPKIDGLAVASIAGAAAPESRAGAAGTAGVTIVIAGLGGAIVVGTAAGGVVAEVLGTVRLVTRGVGRTGAAVGGVN